MREVIISQTVRDKIDDLELFLRNVLKLSKGAAKRRCDRMDGLFESLGSAADYPLCRFKKWQVLGYRCVVFEKDWIFAYEVFEGGVIVRDMSHTSLLTE
jgi:hypothetical protein